MPSVQTQLEQLRVLLERVLALGEELKDRFEEIEAAAEK